jgi:rare lipoprotein A
VTVPSLYVGNFALSRAVFITMESLITQAARPFAEAALLSLIAVSALTLWPRQASPTAVVTEHASGREEEDPTSGGLDLSARERSGVASFYASQFFWKRMADGAPMNPHGSNAASRTLPLGTVARVTDVATGRSAVIKIEDRGPYVGGRIVDLSPSTAREIGLTRRVGLARVVVKPIAVPLPGGGLKLSTDVPESDLRLAASMAATKG